jgi:hypothetical protein
MPPEGRFRLELKRLGQRLGLAGLGSPAPAAAAPSAIVAFHCEDGTDHAGRRHHAILAFDDEAMHQGHDFIQWLFPLPEPSRAFHAAPVLSEADLAVMRRSEICQARLDAAHARMMRFLLDNPHWLRPHDHNHLRITRMIRSTRLIAGDAVADRLRAVIMDHTEAHGADINPITLTFWASA